MNIQRIATDSLKPNPRNARTHSTKQIHQIAESVKQFGFIVPIVIDEKRTILAGHGRHAAAKLLRLTEVPVVEVAGLSPSKKRALALADNKIAENAGWDRETLAVELSELAELLIEEDLRARSGRRLPRSGLICSALDVSPIALDIWRIDAAPHRRV